MWNRLRGCWVGARLLPRGEASDRRLHRHRALLDKLEPQPLELCEHTLPQEDARPADRTVTVTHLSTSTLILHDA